MCTWVLAPNVTRSEWESNCLFVGGVDYIGLKRYRGIKNREYVFICYVASKSGVCDTESIEYKIEVLRIENTLAKYFSSHPPHVHVPKNHGAVTRSGCRQTEGLMMQSPSLYNSIPHNFCCCHNQSSKNNDKNAFQCSKKLRVNWRRSPSTSGNLLSELLLRNQYASWLYPSAVTDVWETRDVVAKICAFLTITDLLKIRRLNVRLCEYADFIIADRQPKRGTAVEKILTSIAAAQPTPFPYQELLRPRFYQQYTFSPEFVVPELEEFQSLIGDSLEELTDEYNYDKNIAQAFETLWLIPRDAFMKDLDYHGIGPLSKNQLLMQARSTLLRCMGDIIHENDGYTKRVPNTIEVTQLLKERGAQSPTWIWLASLSGLCIEERRLSILDEAEVSEANLSVATTRKVTERLIKLPPEFLSYSVECWSGPLLIRNTLVPTQLVSKFHATGPTLAALFEWIRLVVGRPPKKSLESRTRIRATSSLACPKGARKSGEDYNKDLPSQKDLDRTKKKGINSLKTVGGRPTACTDAFSTTKQLANPVSKRLSDSTRTLKFKVNATGDEKSTSTQRRGATQVLKLIPSRQVTAITAVETPSLKEISFVVEVPAREKQALGINDGGKTTAAVKKGTSSRLSRISREDKNVMETSKGANSPLTETIVGRTVHGQENKPFTVVKSLEKEPVVSVREQEKNSIKQGGELDGSIGFGPLLEKESSVTKEKTVEKPNIQYGIKNQSELISATQSSENFSLPINEIEKTMPKGPGLERMETVPSNKDRSISEPFKSDEFEFLKKILRRNSENKSLEHSRVPEQISDKQPRKQILLDVATKLQQQLDGGQSVSNSGAFPSSPRTIEIVGEGATSLSGSGRAQEHVGPSRLKTASLSIDYANKSGEQPVSGRKHTTSADRHERMDFSKMSRQESEKKTGDVGKTIVIRGSKEQESTPQQFKETEGPQGAESGGLVTSGNRLGFSSIREKDYSPSRSNLFSQSVSNAVQAPMTQKYDSIIATRGNSISSSPDEISKSSANAEKSVALLDSNTSNIPQWNMRKPLPVEGSTTADFINVHSISSGSSNIPQSETELENVGHLAKKSPREKFIPIRPSSPKAKENSREHLLAKMAELRQKSAKESISMKSIGSWAADLDPRVTSAFQGLMHGEKLP